MNYLTAPHVLIWSAVVASCSIPGVWEPQRLMVKDANGTIRYESSEGARFSDGSMEQDLPMQQLSEMFNVNHFIVSQANPHAVMFASFSHLKQSVIWPNPLTGLFSSVLTFLKQQCRSWLQHFVQMVGGQRFAPQHATSRGLYSRFFIQEYEGRECDISLIPWINHCSLVRTLLYVLYNPTEKDYRDWSAAAERETWKFLPAIKSHVAEEITLDRCVQRLRSRVIEESLDVRRRLERGMKLGGANHSRIARVGQKSQLHSPIDSEGVWSTFSKAIPHQSQPSGQATGPAQMRIYQ
jgi:TAG lipase / steryl ester hydrolase / phospholipase A2 / LPA acyltransferase